MLASRLCGKVFAFVKRYLSERSGGEAPGPRKGVRGKDGTSCPRFSTQWAGARKRSGIGRNVDIAVQTGRGHRRRRGISSVSKTDVYSKPMTFFRSIPARS